MVSGHEVDYNDLTVGVFNIERFGYDPDHGHHRLPAALEFLLEHTPVPPDVLAFPEATRGLADRQRAIRRHTVHRLSPHLKSGWYEPLFAPRPLPGRKNHLHLLLVNTAKVHPLGWADPHAPEDPGKRHHGWAECEIFGHEVNICCEHWPGGDGREAFDAATNRVSTMGSSKRKSLLLGDFNADSGWERELHITKQLDWHAQCAAEGNLDKLEQKGWFNPATGRWEVDTRQIDKLRSIFGYKDMGEEAGDPTLTTKPAIGQGLRIDRIFRSLGLPATVIHYQVVQPPRPISDHGYVFGTYRLPVLAVTH